MIDIKQEIKSAYDENRLAICSSIAILFLSLVLGYFLEPYLYDFFNPVVEELTENIQSGVIQLTFHDIFSNNIQIVFSMFIFGLAFCFSALILAFNGFFTGYYVATSGDLISVLVLVIPHGIFEFSSCVLACSSGFVLFNAVYIFFKMFLAQSNGNVTEGLKMSFDASFNKLKQAFILLAISAVLMAIAGFVEVYLTIHIGEFLLGFLG